jgi:hypothetical protein
MRLPALTAPTPSATTQLRAAHPPIPATTALPLAPGAASARRSGQSLAALTTAAAAAVRAGDATAAAAALDAGGLPTFDPDHSLAEYATLLRAIGARPLTGTEGALILLLVGMVAARDPDKRLLHRAWLVRRLCSAPREPRQGT